jgi:hypothetical protein
MPVRQILQLRQLMQLRSDLQLLSQREPLPMLGAALPFFIIHAIINTIINIQYSNK